MTSSGWSDRDIALVGDVTGDGAADLIYRSHTEGRLRLREGKPDDDGAGTDVLSLDSAAASRTGTDAFYGAGNWVLDNITTLVGTPDATGDAIPDMWVLFPEQEVSLYPGGPTQYGDRYKVIDSAEGTNWTWPETVG